MTKHIICQYGMGLWLPLVDMFINRKIEIDISFQDTQRFMRFSPERLSGYLQ